MPCAGVTLGAVGAALRTPVTWGVILGLCLGKFIGISLFAWAGVRFGGDHSHARVDDRLAQAPRRGEFSMSDGPKSFFLSPEAHAYLLRHGTEPDAIQRALIEETAKLGGISLMQIAPEQGAFMTILTRLIGAKVAVEVGTFTGYSSLCIARGLAAGGRLICCDVSDEWTAIGREFWARAGVADRRRS